MSCFDGIPHENIEHCPNDELQAGLTTKLYYVPCHFIKTFAMPTPGADLESRVKVGTGGIVLNTGKKWAEIDIQVEQNELKPTLIGNKGNKKFKTELDFTIPGMKGKGLGYMDAYKNVPCVYAIKDANGALFVIGNKDVGAYIDTAEGTSGKTVEDNSGITCKIAANTKTLLYDGEISLAPAP